MLPLFAPSPSQVYEGQYHNDKRHGEGVYKWPNGASFTGTFKEDLKHGLGTYISPHGVKFEVGFIMALSLTLLAT